MKPCTRCGEVKPLDDFSPNRLHSDGLQSACRVCVAKAAAKRRRAQPKARARDRATNAANSRAVWRLAELHPDEFAALVAEERQRAGLPPSRGRVRSP